MNIKTKSKTYSLVPKLKMFFKFSDNGYIHLSIAIFVLLSLFIWLYAWSIGNINNCFKICISLFFLQFASFFAGSFLGFLFGFPSHDTQQFSDKYQRNSSLREITSWLTKIIVGVTLIEFKNLYHSTNILIKNISIYLVGDLSQVVIVGCIISAFSILGFIVFYILSVTVIFAELVQNEKNIESILSKENITTELYISNTLNEDYARLKSEDKTNILHYVTNEDISSLEPIFAIKLGKLLFRMKEYSLSANAFKNAYERTKDAQSLLNYCYIKSQFLKEYEHSNKELKKFIQANAEFAPAYYNLACNYYREFKAFKGNSDDDYIVSLKTKSEEMLKLAFQKDKGLYSEALNDQVLEGLDIKSIFESAKPVE